MLNTLELRDGRVVPPAWSWERDAAGFYRAHHTFFVAAAIAYYPVIFGLKALFKNRSALDLGGGGSKAVINYIFWWELTLALFSIIGAYASDSERALILSKEGEAPSAVTASASAF